MDHHQRVLILRRAPRGMTLIETVMSLTILSVILLIASQLSMSMSAVTAEETAETQVQTDLRRAMSELIFLLEESRPVAMWKENQISVKLPHLPTAPDGTYNYNQNEDLKDRGLCFTFSVPIKEVSGRLRRKGTTSANKLDYGQVFYGAGDGGANLESEYVAGVNEQNSYTVFFLPNGEVLDEAVEGIDLDSNGVSTDKFIYGGLFLSQDNTQQIRQITGRIAIKKFVGLGSLYPLLADEFPARFDDRRGKCFLLEYEPFVDGGGGDANGIYDAQFNDDFPNDTNGNNIWDVKMIIKFYFPRVENDPRRGKVFRLRAVETRINYFRNTYKRNR